MQEANKLPSQRQIELVQHLANGLTLSQAATRMFISVNTAKKHLQRITTVCGKRGQPAIVADFFRRQLIS